MTEEELAKTCFFIKEFFSFVLTTELYKVNEQYRTAADRAIVHVQGLVDFIVKDLMEKEPCN